MAMSAPVSASTTGVLNVLHVVAAPCSKTVAEAVLSLLQCCNRVHWYPALFVESDTSEHVTARLVDAARLMGVPVMLPRSPRGMPMRDRFRLLFDEWFYVRDSKAAVVHMHTQSVRGTTRHAACLRILVPRLPVLHSTYFADLDSPDLFRVTIRAGSATNAAATFVASPLDAHRVNRLYARLLERSD